MTNVAYDNLSWRPSSTITIQGVGRCDLNSPPPYSFILSLDWTFDEPRSSSFSSFAGIVTLTLEDVLFGSKQLAPVCKFALGPLHPTSLFLSSRFFFFL
jgi:hypothetical protein